MITGPIFRVEMVTAARRRRYFYLRVLFGALILCILWMTYANTRYMQTGGEADTLSISQRAQVATFFFYTFTWTQLIGMLAAAPAMAVGTIATERERRTIEYLFASDLSNLEIVLGKTLARLLLIGQLVLVSLPILFLFRLLGGIPADLLAASFLVACSTAVLLTAISVCVSVWSKRSRDATIRVYAVLGALLIVPSILYTTLVFAYNGPANLPAYVEEAIGFLLDLNPMIVLGKSMASIYGMGAGFDFKPVLYMAGWHAALAIGLTALATLAVRRVHLREASRGSSAESGGRKRMSFLPRWRPEIGNHPMVWKEAFAGAAKTKLGFVGSLATGALILCAVGSTLYAFSYSLERDVTGRSYLEYLIPFTGFVSSALLLVLAARSASLITIEKERDCWTSLISTPLTGGEIIRGKLLGNLYALRWGFLLLVIAWLLGCIFNPLYVAIMAVATITFLLIGSFLTSVGLFFSLRSASSLRAMGMTLLVTVVLGGAYLMCCCPLAMMGGGRGGDSMLIGMAPCIPFLMAAPPIMFVEGAESAPVVAYLLGMVGYAAALATLFAYLTMNFDVQAGRTGDLPEGTRRDLVRG